MDITIKPVWLNRMDHFTDEMGHRHIAEYVKMAPSTGVYVYVEGQNYPEFYTNDHKITYHAPEAKFKPGQMVQARNGKGGYYMINRVIPDADGKPLYYSFDNGSVDVRKRGRSGWHPVERANRGFRVVE